MKSRVIAAIVLILSTDSFAQAAQPDCQKLEAARARAWQQLRKSHSAATANRLHARVRTLNEQIAQYCR